MRKLLFLASTMMFATGMAAIAGPFGLPDHEPNGYRDTGCDPAQQVQITNDAGDYLYSNNPTCPPVGGPSDAERAAAEQAGEAGNDSQKPTATVDPKA